MNLHLPSAPMSVLSVPPPLPPSRTNCTRLVPPPVLIGHVPRNSLQTCLRSTGQDKSAAPAPAHTCPDFRRYMLVSDMSPCRISVVPCLKRATRHLVTSIRSNPAEETQSRPFLTFLPGGTTCGAQRVLREVMLSYRRRAGATGRSRRSAQGRAAHEEKQEG